MAVLYTNNASTTLASGITASSTTLSLATGGGTLFPAITAPDFAHVTLVDSSNNIEIVKATARSGDVLTVVRAQEGTTARSFATGSKVDLRVTAAGLANKLDKDTGGTVAGNVAVGGTLTVTGATTMTGGVSGSLSVGGTTVTVNGKLIAQHDGTDGYIRATNAGSKLYLGANNSNSVTIDASGNVGIGSAGGDYSRTWRQVIRQDQNNTTQVGVINGTSGANAVTQITKIGGTSGSFVDWSLVDNTGAPYDAFQYGSVVASVRWSFNGTERFRIASSGAITSADRADAVGYKGLPQNSQTAAYTLALSDIGKHISITTGGVVIPANASVAFPIGTVIAVFNNSTSSQNISITSDTLRLAGSTTTGTRSLANYGLATLVKVATTTWVISGSGVS